MISQAKLSREKKCVVKCCPKITKMVYIYIKGSETHIFNQPTEVWGWKKSLCPELGSLVGGGLVACRAFVGKPDMMTLQWNALK